MDHRWGRNVFDYGLSDLGATLSSRIQGLVTRMYLTNVKTISGYVVAWIPPPDAGVQVYTPMFFLPGANPHFPYGFNVEPDAPV